MKKEFKLILVVFLMVIFQSISAEQRKFRIYAYDNAPWHFQHPGTKEVVGIVPDIMREIAKELDIDLKFYFAPGKRCWEMVSSGEGEMMLSLAVKESRKGLIYYGNESISSDEFVFFVHKDLKKSNIKGTIQDMKKYNQKIGIIRGASVNKEFWEAFPYKDGTTSYKIDGDDYNGSIQAVSSYVLGMRMVGRRRELNFLALKNAGRYIANQEGVEVDYYDYPLIERKYPIALSKKSKYPNLLNLAEKIDNELIKMKQNGSYKKIMDEWIR